MRIAQPGAQFIQRRILMTLHMRQNGVMQSRQQPRRVRALGAGRDLSCAIAALSCLDHIRDADAEPPRHRSRAALSRQYPNTQVLRVSLSAPPNHLRLRSMPETYESHLWAVPEPQIAIPARVSLL
jgi:hypothetical protein